MLFLRWPSRRPFYYLRPHGQRRSWRVALCLTASLTAATPAAAQIAPGSTAVTSPISFVHDEYIAVLNAAEPDFVLGDITPKLCLSLVKHTYPTLDRFAGHVMNGTFAQQPVRSRDSLRNGTIIGTVIGAAAFGAFAAVLCNAYQEEGSGSCLPDTLRFAAIGGAIGAGAGLAIDAARSQSGVTVRFVIRF